MFNHLNVTLLFSSNHQRISWKRTNLFEPNDIHVTSSEILYSIAIAWTLIETSYVLADHTKLKLMVGLWTLKIHNNCTSFLNCLLFSAYAYGSLRTVFSSLYIHQANKSYTNCSYPAHPSVQIVPVTNWKWSHRMTSNN